MRKSIKRQRKNRLQTYRLIEKCAWFILKNPAGKHADIAAQSIVDLYCDLKHKERVFLPWS